MDENMEIGHAEIQEIDEERENHIADCNEVKDQGLENLELIRDEYSQKLREIRDDPDKSVSLVDLAMNEEICEVPRVNSDPSIPKQNFSFDLSLDARTSSSQSCPINDFESKLLEEQATMKRLLDEATARSTDMAATVSKRDEIIASLYNSKNMLEKEKQILKREVELATREKESAVIRYATVEKSILDAKSAKENAEKKLRDAQKETEQANTRMKIAITEKTRVCGLYDIKCQDLRLCQREVERLRLDLTSTEVKLKSLQLKAKTESEGRQIAESRIEELNNEVTQLKLSEISRAKEEIETEKALVTEKQFMEQSATLILLKHENEEKERRIEILDKKLFSTVTDLTELNTKFRQISTENERNKTDSDQRKKEIDELQLQLDKEIMKVAELQSKVNEIESLRTQLVLSKDENMRIRRDLDSTNLNYDELCQEVEKIRSKETELLQFNRELTERCVKFQNESALLNSKVVAVDLENQSIRKDKSYYNEIIETLEKELTGERQQRNEERILLTKHTGEKTKLAESLQRELDLEKGDMDALKKKHSQTVKELNRELNQMRKRIEMLEARPNVETQEPDPRSDLSSTSGDSDSTAQISETLTPTTNNLQLEPSKKTLIERILRLQHATARQAEKIDFLENHSATLLAELQKKTKLIQSYMLREQSVGALSSSKSDKNKAELSKYGGIMAAVYSGAVKANSGEMTLELSLEINKKLQALLEDTILKNITLKENVDTLGLEVDALIKKQAVNK